ncbi:hypothetical protein HerbRD11066_03410 [Herbidospora sp. RD11066]
MTVFGGMSGNVLPARGYWRWLQRLKGPEIGRTSVSHFSRPEFITACSYSNAMSEVGGQKTGNRGTGAVPRFPRFMLWPGAGPGAWGRLGEAHMGFTLGNFS